VMGQFQNDVWPVEGEATEAKNLIQNAILNLLQIVSLENMGQNQS
jgi:hypothetical protein